MSSTSVAAALLMGLLISPVVSQDFFYDHGLPSHVTASTKMKAYQNEVRVLTDFWYTSARYTYVADAKREDAGALDLHLSSNLMAHVMPVDNVRALYQNIKAAHVAGVTLFLDFPFPMFPDNLGTWVEALLPLYSLLATGHWLTLVPPGYQHIDQVLFVNLKREQIQQLQWVWSMLRLTLAPGAAPGRLMPRLIFFEELEYMDQALWVHYELVVVPRDRSVGGPIGFATPEIGRRFRAEAYALAGVKQVPQQPAATITYLMSIGEVVSNNDAALATLQDIGAFLGLRARPVSMTQGAAFQSFVSIMSKTGLLVTRHGPQMANAIFLPPGAVVLELLAYNWDWRGTSDVYYNATSSIGDIHHFAWRAERAKWAAYEGIGETKYADWNIEECMSSRQCLEVHARVGMVVDTGTMHEILMDVLPAALRGEPVAALRRPWPKGARPNAATGLWSDIR